MYRKMSLVHRVFLILDPDWFISASGSDSPDCGQNYSTACSTFDEVLRRSAFATDGQNDTFVLSVATDTDISVTVPEVSEPILSSNKF